MSGTKMETVTLNNGATIPLLGMGVYQLHGKVCEYAVQEALELGYRLFDTAQMYQAMRDAHRDEKQGGVPLPPEKTTFLRIRCYKRTEKNMVKRRHRLAFNFWHRMELLPFQSHPIKSG